ncbi:hypothetical protein [Lentzea sp. E54]|uniref:hypothetical protein n=1 Tax=Lentzea xerophila TaxID=3435883 RepID=UPI003DA21309
MLTGTKSRRHRGSGEFGGGWQQGRVVLRASSREAAVRVMDALLRAFAAEPRLEPLVVDAAGIPERGQVDRRRSGGGRVPGRAEDP